MRDLTKGILENIRRAAALQLWQLGAVKVNLHQPFKLASGNFSPIYINCRKLVSSASFSDLFAGAARVLCEWHSVEFDFLAGGETAGIPFAAFLARAFGKPMIYVRKSTKDHGIASLVEGLLTAAARVLLVEDLITDAGSKMRFIEGIEAAGSTVKDVLVVFDRMQGGRRALARRGIRLHSLVDMATTLNVAQDARLLNQTQMAAVGAYLKDAGAWHRKRGLNFHD